MQLNPLSIDSVTAAIAIAQKRGRLGEVAELVEEGVDRQPENPDVWLRAYAVQHFIDDAPARIASVRRLLELDPHESRVPFDAVPGDVAARSASATGTPLVVEVLPAPPPAIGPPAPDARPLIGPERPASAGGTTVAPVRRSAKRVQSPFQTVPERDVRLPAEFSSRARGVDRDVLDLAQARRRELGLEAVLV